MYQQIETLDDLIVTLQEFAEYEREGKRVGELPVHVAYQQSWPLAGRVSAVTVCKHDDELAVWLAESPGYNLDYAPRNAWCGGIEGEDFDEEGYEL